MTIEEWAKDFKSYVNALDMQRDDYNGIMECIDDALALLKEQEPAKPREERHEVKVSHDWGDEVEVRSKFYCPHCGAMIASGNSQHFPRCMWCGQAVKWE